MVPCMPRICLASIKTAAVGNTLARRWMGRGAWPDIWLDCVKRPLLCGASTTEEAAVEKLRGEGEEVDDGRDLFAVECVGVALPSNRSSRSTSASSKSGLQYVAIKRQLSRASYKTCVAVV